MSSEVDAPTKIAQRAAFIHRETLQLSVLVLIAVAAFFVTRAVASNNRQMVRQTAAEWYRRGQLALATGDSQAAIEAFRRGVVRDRADSTYVLALAGALAAHHDDEAARRVLLGLRESTPEDPQINLELARLAARRGDVDEAARFFHNALFAPWPIEQEEARQRVRLELVQFLLTHGDAARALSELLGVVTELPDSVTAHRQVAELFGKAGDDAHALDQFQRALQLAPEDAGALVGAGNSAFRLGQYERARTYLRRAPSGDDDVAATREIVEHVLSDDPLAPRLGRAERRRRLDSNLKYVRERLTTCVTGSSAPALAGSSMVLQQSAEQLSRHLERSGALDQDAVEAGTEVVEQIVRLIGQSCKPLTPRDRALALIGRLHGSEAK